VQTGIKTGGADRNTGRLGQTGLQTCGGRQEYRQAGVDRYTNGRGLDRYSDMRRKTSIQTGGGRQVYRKPRSDRYIQTDRGQTGIRTGRGRQVYRQGDGGTDRQRSNHAEYKY
jgi:hypothetical protein